MFARTWSAGGCLRSARSLGQLLCHLPVKTTAVTEVTWAKRGTTTTPFDMAMLNDLDRFHLVIDVIDRVEGLASRAAELRQRMVDARQDARRYTREHGEDDP